MAAKKILIVGPSWVGDMVMAQALFITLRQRFADCEIDVLAPAWSLPILARMPEVRRGIAMPVGHGKLELGLRYSLARELAGQYQQAIVLPNSLKSALIPLLAGIPLRTGWRGEMRFGLLNDIRLLNKKRYPLMVQRFVALADSGTAPVPEHWPLPALQADTALAASLFRQLGMDAEQPLLALCPGAEFGPAKRWPERHFTSLAAHYIDQGWQVALFGSDNDCAVTTAIAAELSPDQAVHCHNLAGRTQLSEAVDILSAAAAVVSNDSGLMHIAAALARPLVVLYGSTSPTFTPPLSDRVRVLQLAVDCGPCFKRECPLAKDRGAMACLEQLGPQQAIAALASLLADEADLIAAH